MSKSLFTVLYTFVSSAAILAAPVQASSDATFDEVPSAVAIADTGLAAVGLANARRASIITVDNSVASIDVGCTVSDIAADPAGTWGWSVCSDNTYLGVTSLATGATGVADHKVPDAFEIRYSSATKTVVILGAGGLITTMSAKSINDYEILKSVNVGEAASALALAPNGRTAYVATETGKLAVVDLKSGKSKKVKLPASKKSMIYASDIAIDPTGRFLVLGGAEIKGTSKKATPVVLTMNARTGRQISRQAVEFDMGDSTSFSLAVGRDKVYVGTGLKIKTVTPSTGLVQFGLDSRGRLGAPAAVGVEPVIVSELAVTSDGRTLAVATTNGTFLRISR